MSSRHAPGLSPLRIQLDNGLDVALLHQPGLTRTAAALRIQAGSHDAPTAYPGLAHFLEHLVFLGSARFPSGQGLIPFVQSQGGLVNASTQERHTDFFFELPHSAIDGGLARLCDMIAAPTLTLDSQKREREVLHAEFLAWSRSEGPGALALAASLPPEHPSSRFHAGNRYSLPIHQPAFQAALQDHHRRYYRTGQKTLVLVGPQPLDELQWLAQRHAGPLGSAPARARPVQPALLPLRRGCLPVPSDSEFSIAFVLDQLPEGAGQALDLLRFWLVHEHSGGWFGRLRQAGIAEHLDTRVSFVGERQAILHINLQLPPRPENPSGVMASLFSWLRFLEAAPDLHCAYENYARVRLRQLETMGPLALARHWLGSDLSSPGLYPDALAALPAVLAQLQPTQWVQLRGSQGRADEYHETGSWHLPPANRFLQGDQRPDTSQPAPADPPRLPACLRVAPEPPGGHGVGALFLRWRSTRSIRGQQQLLGTLQTRLAPAIVEARQAGVEVRLVQQQVDWELSLIGIASAIPAVLQAVLEQLKDRPTPSDRTGGKKSGGILIQQMLYNLEYPATDAEPCSAGEPEAAWYELWQSATWDGLAFALDEPVLAQVATIAQAIPGQAAAPLPSPERPPAVFRWQPFETADPQHALLLFCAQPDEDTLTEAAWRLLAQLIEAPFYQRMRTELQVGYGVFSGYRHVRGQPGVLFGIQSPSIPPAESLRLVEQFLASFSTHLSTLKPETLRRYSAQLCTRFDDPRQAAEQQWQACKDGQVLGVQRLRDALSTADINDLLRSLDDLRRARGGWHCMANGEPARLYSNVGCAARTGGL